MTALGAIRSTRIGDGSASSGGHLPLVLGISIVRHPIPERTYDYVSASGVRWLGRAISEHEPTIGRGGLGSVSKAKRTAALQSYRTRVLLLRSTRRRSGGGAYASPPAGLAC